MCFILVGIIGVKGCRKRLFCYKMTKIPLDEVMCLAYGFIQSNLIVKLDIMVKVVLVLKLNN